MGMVGRMILDTEEFERVLAVTSELLFKYLKLNTEHLKATAPDDPPAARAVAALATASSIQISFLHLRIDAILKALDPHYENDDLYGCREGAEWLEGLRDQLKDNTDGQPA